MRRNDVDRRWAETEGDVDIKGSGERGGGWGGDRGRCRHEGK